MKHSFIRMPEACRRTGLCRSWLYHLIRAGEFPKPVKIGSYAVAFVESEVDEWINLRIAKSRKLAPEYLLTKSV